jgi:hypothetical protein
MYYVCFSVGNSVVVGYQVLKDAEAFVRGSARAWLSSLPGPSTNNGLIYLLSPDSCSELVLRDRTM